MKKTSTKKKDENTTDKNTNNMYVIK